MIHVLTQVEVEDFDRFLESFNTRGLRLRRLHGSHGSRVFRQRHQPNRVALLFEWESPEALDGFLADPEVRETMRLGGTIGKPELTVLDEVEDLPA